MMRDAHFPNTQGLQPSLPRRIRKPRVVPHTLYPTTRRPPSLPLDGRLPEALMAFSRKALKARGTLRKQGALTGSYQDIARQGEQAWLKGMDATANPHQPGSEDHEIWHEHYQDAREAFPKRSRNDRR